MGLEDIICLRNQGLCAHAFKLRRYVVGILSRRKNKQALGDTRRTWKCLIGMAADNYCVRDYIASLKVLIRRRTTC